ncbi:hypothetical protein L484_003632 [Morus notabilis]|uniref:Uncharacterized protein n=1 Tax=Morus notabilis TaxID=981085 RepID=W9RE09_9ROSA|nr:hypothetical protein L484_003632 [Morus notabilis]
MGWERRGCPDLGWGDRELWEIAEWGYEIWPRGGDWGILKGTGSRPFFCDDDDVLSWTMLSTRAVCSMVLGI